MPETVIDLPYDLAEITRNLVTEDDVPVDNLFSAKQRRLLVEPLYSSWQPPAVEGSTAPRIFLADSDVGIFSSPHQPPIAPDMFLSLDVEPNPEYFSHQHRAYFMWEFDKAPEVALEIVSNRKGNEMDAKIQRYARIGIDYEVIFDPQLFLSSETLKIYELNFASRRYNYRSDFLLPELGLRLQLWCGEFEGTEAAWLRWCDANGNLIPTEAERADAEAERAESEAAARQRAEAELERLRAELQRLQNKG